MIKIIVILFDSLRNDATGPLHGIFPEESWSSFQTVETFTAPVLATTITGKTPEELGLPRDDSAFFAELDPSKIDDTLFDHFDSHISIGRLIGPETGPIPLPPSRRGRFKILPPIKWNAVSNWEPDIFQYVGRKWSIATKEFPDLIWFHAFCTHGCYGVYDSMGSVETPEIKNCDRLMKRLAVENPKKLREWYMRGVYYAAETLRSINAITGGKETIICFADHGEALTEKFHGELIPGHHAGMQELPELGTVPVWINKKEKIPDNISHLTLKDWIVKMYEKYEKNNPEYQAYKQAITQGKPVEQPENWNIDLTPEDEAQIKERLIKLGYLGETEKPKAKK